MSEIKVTSSELKTKADELQGYNTSFKAEVEKMVGYEQELAAMWEGDAQKAFHKAFSDDKEKMDKFNENITKYVQALQTAADKYDQAETVAVQTAQTRNS